MSWKDAIKKQYSKPIKKYNYDKERSQNEREKLSNESVKPGVQEEVRAMSKKHVPTAK